MKKECQKKIAKIVIGVAGLSILVCAAIHSQEKILAIPELAGIGALVFGWLLATGFHIPKNLVCK